MNCAAFFTWLDLCCGSLAVTLRLIGGHDAPPPPASYMGGKRRWAESILDLMGVRGRRPERVVLCDAGEWGAFWQAVLVDGHGPAVVAQLRQWARDGEKGEALWHELESVGVPDDPAERAAAFVALQAANHASKPVCVSGDGVWWNTAGYAHLSALAVSKGFRERLLPHTIADRLQAVLGLDWPPVTVLRALDDVQAEPGAVAYIDPPYAGTTGYGLPEVDVPALAARLAAQGARVAVSEGRPLPFDGWHHARPQPGRTWQACTFGPTDEWLTLSQPAAPQAEQMALALEASCTPPA